MNSKIGKWEWRALYFIAIIIDIGQILLDILVGPGEVANALIEIGIPLLLGIYFHIRGISMNNPKALFNLIGNFVGEEITLEIWPGTFLIVLFTHKIVKAEQNPEKLSSKIVLVAASVNKMAEKMEGETGGENVPLNVDGIRQPPVIQKPLNQGGMRLPNGGVS